MSVGLQVSRNGQVKKNKPVVEPTVIPFNRPDIGDDEIEAVSDVIASGWVGPGPVARDFGDNFSEFLGGYHCVPVSSCTVGLNMALRVSNVGKGCDVVTTPMTFAATLNAILRAGARPILVDVDENGNINPDLIRYAMKDNNVKAIIPVHYTGASCRMDQIMQIAQQYSVKIIEDAAHGLGGQYVGSNNDKPTQPKKLGTIGDYGVFSFHANKTMTTGEGGMVVTKYADMAERIRILANQGQSNNAWDRAKHSPNGSYQVVYDGYKGAMADINAAIGLVQLQRWDEMRKRRAKIWDIYENSLGLKDQGHSMYLYTILVKNRDLVRASLYDAGIHTGIHYTPLHLEPAYKSLGYKKGDFKNAERIGEQTLSLPVSSTMTEDDALRVVRSVKKFMDVTT